MMYMYSITYYEQYLTKVLAHRVQPVKIGFRRFSTDGLPELNYPIDARKQEMIMKNEFFLSDGKKLERSTFERRFDAPNRVGHL